MCTFDGSEELEQAAETSSKRMRLNEYFQNQGIRDMTNDNCASICPGVRVWYSFVFTCPQRFTNRHSAYTPCLYMYDQLPHGGWCIVLLFHLLVRCCLWLNVHS